MARAIVTYARGWHALAITRSLGRQGIEVICGEEASFAPCFFSKYCTDHFKYPSVTDEPERFLDVLLETVKKHQPPDGEPYVLMPVHKETWLIAQDRERFEPYIQVPLTTHENMARTHDKGKLAVLATELGITIPGTQQFDNLEELYRAVPEIEFPVFLKVREGAAGVGLKKCDTPEDLTSTFRKFVDGFKLEPDAYPLVQQFVRGEDYCVTALFDHGRRIACMTYRNVRAFPRGTGAGALRETVHLTDAENAACQLLEHLNWHGMAELDFRVGDDGVPYLIELNPRFFGGLHQAIAANVDYPHLLFRIAAGETIEQAPRADETVRTEAPVIGLLATLDEIAHDERVLERLRHVRDAAGSDRLNPEDSRLKSFFRTLREAANPKDVKAYVNEMFEKHHGAINDVLQSDDPRPVLGMMFPVVMMLKHGRISMGVITGEEDAGSPRPRRRFRDMLMHPTWTTLLLTATLYALSVFTTNADITRDNIGWVFGLPGRVAELVAGRVEPDQMGTIGGAIRHTCYHALNLFFWYLIAARLRRERPSET